MQLASKLSIESDDLGKIIVTSFNKVMMVLYSILFVYLIITANQDNFEIGYPLMLTIGSILVDATAAIGNFLYAFNVSNDLLRNCWKFFFPVLAFHFFLFMYLDLTVPKDMQGESEILIVVIAVLCFILYLPAFWANYNIGYRQKVASNSNTNSV